jgi:hypothetical protein
MGLCIPSLLYLAEQNGETMKQEQGHSESELSASAAVDRDREKERVDAARKAASDNIASFARNLEDDDLTMAVATQQAQTAAAAGEVQKCMKCLQPVTAPKWK